MERFSVELASLVQAMCQRKRGQEFLTKESAMLNLEDNVVHVRRRGWLAVVALLGTGIVACSSPSGPPAPGSILVKTETAGFLKATGYQVLVNGVSTNTVGANDEVTISGLDPGSYTVDLGDVPDNCSVEGVTVAVESDMTPVASLSVSCAYGDLATYTIQFNQERPNLDTGTIMSCPFGICPTKEGWDLFAQNNAQTEPRSVIRQNQNTGFEVEIAHLPGVTLAGLTEADYKAATFTTALVGDPFDVGRVILIRTASGTVYALGNPSENLTTLRLTFSAALIDTP